MKLRDHPLMTYHRMRSWPPVWTPTRKGSVERVIGEVGILKYVNFHRAAVTLVIDYNREKFIGTLSIDNPPFCDQICKVLQTNVGHSIKEIGDLDLSHTLKKVSRQHTMTLATEPTGVATSSNAIIPR